MYAQNHSNGLIQTRLLNSNGLAVLNTPKISQLLHNLAKRKKKKKYPRAFEIQSFQIITLVTAKKSPPPNPYTHTQNL